MNDDSRSRADGGLLDRRSLVVGLGAFASGVACSSGSASAGSVAPTPSQPKKGAVEIGLVSPEIDRYAAAHSVTESAVMAAIAAETKATTEWWIMMIGPVEAALLKLLVRLLPAKRVLEIGTFTGYSAIAMAEALPEDGELITCDISEEWTAIAQKHWRESPDGKKIHLELGDAAETLGRLDGPFDLVFIDADKDSQIGYWESVVPKLSRNGLIVVDNVLSRGTVIDAAPGHVVAAFNEHVRADQRMQSIMLPIRDGVTIAWNSPS